MSGNLAVDISDLTLENIRLNSDIILAIVDRTAADDHIDDVKTPIQRFNTDLNTAVTKLNEALVKANAALTYGQNYIGELTREVTQLSTQIDNARSSANAARARVRTIQSQAQSAPLDTQSALILSDSQSQVGRYNNQVSSLTSQQDRTESRISDARTELTEIREVIQRIQEEIEETTRMQRILFVANLHIGSYNQTKPAFDGTFDRARELVSKIFEFGRKILEADGNGAQLIEREYIDGIRGVPSLESIVILKAASQVGALETRDNFVDGKPFAQDEVAWCADFVRWVLEDSGIDIDSHGRDALASTYAVARAWAYHGTSGGGYGRWGTAADAEPGDLLIDRYNGTPSTGGHISIIIETNVNGNPNLVRTIGGNEEDPTGNSPDGVRDQIKDLTQSDRYLVTLAEFNNN